MTSKLQIRAGIAALVVAALMPAMATAQTLERIKDSGTINIAYVKDAAPFSSLSSSGVAEGYSVDLCKKVVAGVKAKLGVNSLAVKDVATSVEAGLKQVASGDIDILCGSETDTLARRAKVSFSLPIYNGGVGVVIKEDAPEALTRVLAGKVAHTGPTWRATVNRGLANHTYAVHEGTLTEELVRKAVASLGVIVTIVTVDTHQAGVDMVAKGKADAYFADRAILAYYARDLKDVQLLDRYFTYEPIALAYSRGDADMGLVIDTALSELYLSDGFSAFYSDHFGTPGDVTLMFFKSFARQ